MNNKQQTSYESSAGSALILTVVLTSLLAIVGVLFVLVSRLDKIATTGLSENKELNSAAETVIAKLSQDLVLDVPGVADANEEYYDYPDANNAWLACLEPYQQPNGNYYWRQISDIYEVLEPNAPDLQADIIDDYQTSIFHGLEADADGDGIADSVWVKIPHMTSGKGKPIYAAVRIVDNGGMLNVNTACLFNPLSTDPNYIDGSSQMQINLTALAGRLGHPADPVADSALLLKARAGDANPYNLKAYEENVIWRYGNPVGTYTPFDIGDELELRYRFLINHEDIRTRIERLWTWSFNCPSELNTPIKRGGSENTTDWFYKAQHDVIGPNDVYSYRHLATTYNMDRIIRPDRTKMVNVNDSNEYSLYTAIREGLIRGGVVDTNSLAAQIAVNMKDYVDNDNNVTTLGIDDINYYGFERPCIYISELAYREVTTGSPPVPHKSYAVELYKPYSEDVVSDGTWRLNIDNIYYITIDSSWLQDKDYYVIIDQDPLATLSVDTTNAYIKPADCNFYPNSNIWLQRYIADTDANKSDDYIHLPEGITTGEGARSYRRDINPHKCIWALWDPNITNPTLGLTNNYDSALPELQAHPANKNFTNIGEIGTVFNWNTFCEPGDMPGNTEADLRVNLADPNFQQLFNYLTVFPPEEYVSDPNETRIKGRLNINTAPWFVLAQLPWVSTHTPNYELAKAIIAYRDKLDLSLSGPDYSGRSGEPGFRSIGELNRVVVGSNDYRIDYYQLDSGDLAGFPDLTPGTAGDGAADDFEERDAIFARISNLVTVRSDVFTAYILVRIGEDGPQKRAMAILDRSNVYSPADKVRIVALYPVPDPR